MSTTPPSGHVIDTRLLAQLASTVNAAEIEGSQETSFDTLVNLLGSVPGITSVHLLSEELPESDTHNVYFALSDDIFNQSCVHIQVDDYDVYLPYAPHIQSTCNALKWRRDYLENREKVKLFNDVLESTADGYWDWDIQSNQVYYSPRWKSMLGYSDLELTNSFNTWEQLLHPDDHLQATAKARQFHEDPTQDYEIEFRLRCKDGSYKWILARGKVVEWVDGCVAKRVVGTHVDLSKQKQLEMRLISANTKLNREQDLLVKTSEIARIGSWDVNVSDMEVYWSEMTCQIHEVDAGYQPDVERGIDFYKEGWSRDRITEVFSRCIEDGVSFDEELIIITKAGKEKWIRTVGLKDDSDPSKIRVYGLFQDIDKSKRALDALEKSKQQQEVVSQRLKLATNAGRIGVWDWDLLSEALHLDDQMLQLYGVDEKDGPVAYDLLSQALHPDDKEETWSKIDTALSGGTPFDCEHRIVRPDGVVRNVKSNAIVISDDSGKAIRMTGVNFDITEQKNLEKEQSRARNAAEEANRSKSEFVATMSHEIRTPMNGVLGMLHLVLQGNIDAKTRKKLDIALNSAQSLLTIINDILDFSKIESGKLTLEETEFNPVDVFENCINNSLTLAREKHVALRVDLGGILEKSLIGDPVRFAQVVNNLLSNALKFTAKGSVTVRAHTKMGAGTGNYVLTCSVEDSGIGIPADKIDSLFSSFTQVDASTTRKYGGTGLGLAICRRLCELMGGEITVRSEEHVGSIFEFQIPVNQSERKLPEKSASCFKSKQALVLIADEFDRAVLLSYLKTLFKSVGIFSSEEKCLAKLGTATDKRLAPAVIITDNVPSGMLLERLGVEPADTSTKIIVVTTQNTDVDIPDTSEYKTLNTPILPSELTEALRGPAIANNKMPLKDGTTEAVSIPDGPAHKALTEPCKNKILVVDDNQINQEVALGLLEEFNLGGDVAYNGMEALEKIKHAKGGGYSLILMDCQMPEMNGYEATEKIRSGECGTQKSNVPIVAMTANAMTGDRLRCINAGMNDYLSKPLSPDLLKIALDKWFFTNADLTAAPSPISDSQGDLRPKLEQEPSGSETISQLTEKDDGLVWDKDDALKRVRGREDRLKKLVNMYIKNNEQNMRDIEGAVNDLNYLLIADHAHGLKGVSGNLGCTQVNKLSAKLEYMAKNEDRNLVDTWNDLQAAKVILIEVLSAFVSAP